MVVIHATRAPLLEALSLKDATFAPPASAQTRERTPKVPSKRIRIRRVSADPGKVFSGSISSRETAVLKVYVGSRTGVATTEYG